MKQFFRLTALMLCGLMMFGMVSCVKIGDGNEDTPEGMQIASAVNADFRLYVPTTWVVNTAYGVSGAYRDLSRQSSVSMVRYPITEEWSTALDALGTDTAPAAADSGEGAESGETGGTVDPRLTWFFENECLRPVRETALNGAVTMDTENCGPDILDRINAGRWCYQALVNGETLYYKQLVLEREGAFYVFTFTANQEMYEMYLSDVEKMLDAFRFAEPYIPPDYAKKLDPGADTPAGMKACFGDDVAYCFYVPADWEIRMDDSIYAAYVPGDFTSVSVVPYRPEVEHMSVAEFFTMTCEQMEKLYGAGAVRVEEEKTHKEDLGTRQATVYEYTCRVGKDTYRYRQYIAAYRSMIYSVTYTATEENFEKHLEELDRIISAFSFR